MTQSLDANSSLKDYIVVIEDLLSPDLCDKIVQQYHDENFSYDNHHSFGTDVRNLYELNISASEFIDSSNSYVRKLIDNEICEAVKQVSQYHPVDNIVSDTGYSLRRMDTGQFYKEHTDQGRGIDWRISCSICLNDDFTGGDLCFFDGQLKYSMKKGQAISFPSNYLYPHEVSEVLSGTRYAIVTWLM